MGRPRKPASKLTDKEAFRKLFPTPVREEVRKTAKEATKKVTKKESMTPGPFNWWGWLLLPLNALGVVLALPALVVLWLGSPETRGTAE